MNKSIEYIKNRIENSIDDIGDIPLDNWDNVKVINPMKWLESEFNIPVDNNKVKCDLTINKKFKNEITIEYNDKVDYDYFTSDFITHDGTLLFQAQAINKMMLKLLKRETYSKKIATDGFISNPFNYDIKYTIGDILINSDYGIKKINGNKMRGQKDCIVLPVKFEIFKREII
ncbi:hypothetical protein [Clostridium botulinum]|uniref:hypothetical protein n=1 Tax=Clostridium botulinum TaxID=1491 RepID=UPI00174AE576|nr:hypothetical protein [Clostridium botulinum]MBD5589360.1 hypothetical protein [Clostridium botulinum]